MAWNEPGSGHRGKDPWNTGGGGKPPDLEEALRKLWQQLNQFLGGSGASKSGDKLPINKVAITAGIIVLILWTALSVYQVGQAERAVVLRFGKYYETLGPGLQFSPWLIDKPSIINVQEVKAYPYRGHMLTADENIVEVSLNVQYRISELKDYLLEVKDPEGVLALAVESALRHVVGTSKMNEVTTESRANIATQVKERLQAYLVSYKAGLQVTEINMQKADPPEEVQQAFADVNRAKEDQQRFKDQGEAYAKKIIPEAEGQAEKIRQEANGYKQASIAQAEGEAERFSKLYAEYQKAPEVTRKRLYLETMETILSKTSKIMVDVKSSNNLLYLPLDRLSRWTDELAPQATGMESAATIDSTGVSEATDTAYEAERREAR